MLNKIKYLIFFVFTFSLLSPASATVTLIPDPVYCAMDLNGAPLSGGKLYTYAAGTSTPQATYTDSTGGVSNANPVILNSAGCAHIWLGNNSYKFNLLDSNSAQQSNYPVDNVTRYTNYNEFSAFTGNLSSTTYSSQGAGIVGYKESTTATGRTVESRLQDSVSLLDFGADPTGINDSTTALNTALSSLVTTLQTKYSIYAQKALYIPTGIYKISSSIVIPHGVTIYGDGQNSSILSFTNTGDGLKTVSPINSSTAVMVSLKDIAIWNNNGSNTGAGYDDVGGTFIHLDHVQIWGFAYNIIFDQTELADVTNSDLEASTIGSIWLVNGADHTPGGQIGFTNRISIKQSQISFGGANSIGIIDDGGYNHSFIDNNYNGFKNHFRFAGVAGVVIQGGEFEGATSTNMIFTYTTSVLGTGVGSCSSVLAQGFTVSPTTGNSVIQAISLGDLTLNSVGFFNTSSYKIIGGNNIASFFATDINLTGSGGLIDFQSSSFYVNNPFGTVSNIQLHLEATSLVQSRFSQTYTSLTPINAQIANEFDINVTGTSNFTIQNPINALDGEVITISIINTGGSMGSVTWGSSYKMASWTNPANGYSRSITFKYNSTTGYWYEFSRTTTDIPN